MSPLAQAQSEFYFDSPLASLPGYSSNAFFTPSGISFLKDDSSFSASASSLAYLDISGGDFGNYNKFQVLPKYVLSVFRKGDWTSFWGIVNDPKHILILKNEDNDSKFRSETVDSSFGLHAGFAYLLSPGTSLGFDIAINNYESKTVGITQLKNPTVGLYYYEISKVYYQPALTLSLSHVAKEFMWGAYVHKSLPYIGKEDKSFSIIYLDGLPEPIESILDEEDPEESILKIGSGASMLIGDQNLLFTDVFYVHSQANQNDEYSALLGVKTTWNNQYYSFIAGRYGWDNSSENWSFGTNIVSRQKSFEFSFGPKVYKSKSKNSSVSRSTIVEFILGTTIYY